MNCHHTPKTKSNKSIVTLVLLCHILLNSIISVNAETYKGGYTKEMLTTDFTNTGRAFFSLAVVHAPDATGSYLYELSSDESTTRGFLYNGCIVQCIYPPENGWVMVEAHLTNGVLREENLSFDIKSTTIEHPLGRLVHETGLYNDPYFSDAPLGIGHSFEPCHLLGIQWDYAHHHLFYLVETQSAYGYVPMELVEQGER